MDDARQSNDTTATASSLLGRTAFRDALRRAVVWPVATLVIALALLLVVLVHLSRTAQLADHSIAVLAQVSRVEKLLVDMETGVRGYRITGDAAFLEPFQQATATLASDFDTLEDLLKNDPRQLAEVRELRKSHAVWNDFATHVRQRAQTALPSDVAAQLHGKELMDTVRSHISAIQQHERSLLAQRADARGQLRVAAITSVAFFIVVLAPMLVLSIRRAIVRLNRSYENALGSLDTERQRLDSALSTMVTDIRARRRIEILLDSQKRSLEMVVSGTPLCDVLTYLARVVEEQSEGRAIASILLLGSDGLLRNGASPTLPADYLRAIDGLKPCAEVGTCCAAAATGEVVFTPNIETDSKWQSLKHLPLNLGFVAAWSQPITASDGRVLGTFGTYFRETREPTPFERQSVEMLARTAALAIERHRSEEALRASEERFRAFVTTSSDVVYRMNADWSEMRQLKGKDFIADTEAPNRDWLAEYIHPEDRELVLAAIQQSIKTHSPFQLEHRVIRVDGSLGDFFPRHSAPQLGGRSHRMVRCRDRCHRSPPAEDDRKTLRVPRRKTAPTSSRVRTGFPAILCEPRGLAMVGLGDLEDARRTPVKEFFFPEDQDRVLNQFLPKVPRPGGGQIEIRFRHFKTGEARWMLYNVWVIKRRSGEVCGTGDGESRYSPSANPPKRRCVPARTFTFTRYSLFHRRSFCVIEMIFDDDQRPIDYRFIEVNPRSKRQAGMHGATANALWRFVSEI
jgi:CHASE3 domain sensor protein